MGSPDALIRAAVHRIGARVGHGLADTAAELADFCEGRSRAAPPGMGAISRRSA